MERWHRLLTGLCLLLAGIQAWQSRYAVNSDGVSYLDIAGQWLAGHWRVATNAIWPPLYTWVLAAGLGLLRATPDWELPAARVVNFAVFAAALASFRFFLRGYLEAWRKEAEGGVVPETAVVVFGYTLFAFTSLALITTRLLTPDLCAAAAVYLAAGLLMRIQAGATRWTTFAGLGLVLGLGYLARSSLQPVGVVFVLSAALAARSSRSRRLAGVTLGVFLGVTAAWVAAASWANGRLVLNENARINYAWWVNGVSRRYWEGGPHPPRKMLEHPLLLEFDVRWRVTHPLLYDASYWFQGLRPQFRWRQQVEAIRRSWPAYRRSFLEGWQIGFVFVAGLAAALGASRGTLRHGAALLAPALALFGMHALVHAEPRYLAPFVTLFWMGLLFRARLRQEQAQAVTVAVVVLAVVAFPPLVAATLPGAPDRHWPAAAEVRRAGLRAGDKVGLIGLPNPDVMLVRLAGARVVAGVPGEYAEEYWLAPAERREEARRVFEEVGVRVLLAEKKGSPPADQGWRNLAGTSIWYWILR